LGARGIFPYQTDWEDLVVQCAVLPVAVIVPFQPIACARLVYWRGIFSVLNHRIVKNTYQFDHKAELKLDAMTSTIKYIIGNSLKMRRKT